MSKVFFGNMFDFNRDGNLNWIEKTAELAFLDHVMKEESGSGGHAAAPDFDLFGDDEDWRDNYCEEDCGVDPYDYDSEEEYLDAVEEKQAWIDGIDDEVTELADEYGFDPRDYDSYDEFIEALKDETD